jgi:enamine deaminase RidA (YjgF/YER057c/UK114 family)
MAQVVNPETLGSPKGYSNGMLMPAGQILFVAGQIGWDGGGQFVSPELPEQFDKALENVLTVVKEAGGSAEHIGRLTLYVTDKKAYGEQMRAIGKAYRKHMGRHFPAMALVEVADLFEDGALVEIEATAVIP